MSQIGVLLDSMPDDDLRREKPLKARLKYGKRNMILAVVDMGVVSNLRFSEAGFGGGSRWKITQTLEHHAFGGPAR
jgi:tRNA-splicing endonuclease subunit Sen54